MRFFLDLSLFLFVVEYSVPGVPGIMRMRYDSFSALSAEPHCVWTSFLHPRKKKHIWYISHLALLFMLLPLRLSYSIPSSVCHWRLAACAMAQSGYTTLRRSGLFDSFMLKVKWALNLIINTVMASSYCNTPYLVQSMNDESNDEGETHY